MGCLSSKVGVYDAYTAEMQNIIKNSELYTHLNESLLEAWIRENQSKLSKGTRLANSMLTCAHTSCVTIGDVPTMGSQPCEIHFVINRGSSSKVVRKFKAGETMLVMGTGKKETSNGASLTMSMKASRKGSLLKKTSMKSSFELKKVFQKPALGRRGTGSKDNLAHMAGRGNSNGSLGKMEYNEITIANKVATDTKAVFVPMKEFGEYWRRIHLKYKEATAKQAKSKKVRETKKGDAEHTTRRVSSLDPSSMMQSLSDTILNLQTFEMAGKEFASAFAFACSLRSFYEGDELFETDSQECVNQGFLVILQGQVLVSKKASKKDAKAGFFHKLQRENTVSNLNAKKSSSSSDSSTSVVPTVDASSSAADEYRLTSGHCIGEMNLMVSGYDDQNTYMCLSPVLALYIEKHHFDKLLQVFKHVEADVKKCMSSRAGKVIVDRLFKEDRLPPAFAKSFSKNLIPAICQAAEVEVVARGDPVATKGSVSDYLTILVNGEVSKFGEDHLTFPPRSVFGVREVVMEEPAIGSYLVTSDSALLLRIHFETLKKAWSRFDPKTKSKFQLLMLTLTGEDVGLLPVLSSPHGRELFQTHMAKEFSNESLDFYTQAGEYKNLQTEKERQIKGMKIWKEFIPDEAPKQINILSSVRTEIDEMVKACEFPVSLFDAAHKEIFFMMEKDNFARFKLNDSFKDYLQQNSWAPELAVETALETAIRLRDYFNAQDVTKMSGSAIVDWVVETNQCTRESAFLVATLLHDHGFIQPSNPATSSFQDSAAYSFLKKENEEQVEILKN